MVVLVAQGEPTTNATLFEALAQHIGPCVNDADLKRMVNYGILIIEGETRHLLYRSVLPD